MNAKVIASGLAALSLIASTGVASAQYYSYSTPLYVGGAGSSCVNLSSDLSYGSRGASVSQLQGFLVSQNYPGSGSWMVTGYFGPATLSALRNFQSTHGLPVTGMADASTRSAIASVSCGFTYGNYYGNNSYTNQYQQYPWQSYYNNSYLCNNMYSYPYVYNAGNNWGWNSGSSYSYPYCSTQSTPTISYLNPSSGGVGTSVTVFGTGFSTSGNTVYFGNAVISNLSSYDNQSVSFTVPGQLVGYGNQAVYLGTYPVSVTNAAGYTSNTQNFTVTSLGSSGAPTISSINGPASVSAGQSATWTLTVYNPSTSYATVSVNWGDNYAYATNMSSQQLLVQGTQTLSFTHTYYSAGTYTATFTVSGSGGSNTTSSTVSVYGGSVIQNSPAAISVLQPTSGSVGTLVTIYGSGFSASGNVVRFGSGAIMNLPSNNNGAIITFTVPSYLSAYCPGNYACPQYAQLVTPGTYNVSVQNANGSVSNSATFTVQ